MDFEKILKSVGEYGPYQKKLVYYYLIPTTTIFAFYCMNTFFMLSEPDAWCTVPEIAQLDMKAQHLLSRPPSSESPTKMDQCRVYDIDYNQAALAYLNASDENGVASGNFSLNLPANTSTRTCTSWTFDKTNYDATAVTHLNLVCDRAHWVSLILTVHGIGEVVGNPLFGALADAYGRRSIFFVTLAVALSSE